MEVKQEKEKLTIPLRIKVIPILDYFSKTHPYIHDVIDVRMIVIVVINL